MNIREHCNPAREHCRFGWMLKQLRENADPDHEAENAEIWADMLEEADTDGDRFADYDGPATSF